MKRDRWDRLFDDCPGAWYGNPAPRDECNPGTIMVDPERTLEALAYLRRRVIVTAIRPSRSEVDRGIVIAYQPRRRVGVSEEEAPYSDTGPDVLLYTDDGAPCPVCSGTCYLFTLLHADALGGRTVSVHTFCFGCLRADVFFAAAQRDPLAADYSRQHRVACGMVREREPAVYGRAGDLVFDKWTNRYGTLAEDLTGDSDFAVIDWHPVEMAAFGPDAAFRAPGYRDAVHYTARRADALVIFRGTAGHVVREADDRVTVYVSVHGGLADVVVGGVGSDRVDVVQIDFDLLESDFPEADELRQWMAETRAQVAELDRLPPDVRRYARADIAEGLRRVRWMLRGLGASVREGAPTYRPAKDDAADLRRLLRAKGFTGSVRLGRGSACSWVDISGSLPGGEFTQAERDLLRGLGMSPGGNFCVIAPEERRIWIDRLSGRELDPADVAHARAIWQARLDA